MSGVSVRLNFIAPDPDDTAEVIEFRDVEGRLSFDLPPERAISYFQAKGIKPTFAWEEMLGEEHHHSFTVAKMMDVDLLKTVRDAVDEAITTGKDIRWFERNLIPKLQSAGWWGKQAVVDPLTGQIVNAQLGSPARLRTIFRTNLQNAYAVGRWKTMQEQASVAPYAMYDAIDDHRVRPEHAALDELVLPLDDAFWKSHAPPNGWNCRCSLIQLDEHQLKSLLGKDGPDKALRVKTRKWTNPRTGQVLDVPRDLDPGWDHNPGEATTVELDALLKEKIEALPADMRAAAKKVAARTLAAEEAAKAKAAEERAAAKVKARMEAKAAEEAAQAAAQAELEAITAGKLGTAHTQALKKVTQTTSAVKPTELLSEVQEAAAAIKAAKALSANLSKYKSAVLAGKTPTPALVKAFDSLDEAGQAKVLADIEKKKAKQAAQAAAAKAAAGDVTPPRDLELRRMTQIGPQRGSNPGGLYRDLDTGEQWYVKRPPSVEHARNELLAARLYEKTGIEVPELQLIDMGAGTTGVASKIIDGLDRVSGARLAKLTGAHEGFAVDAWLANWDVVGLELDNLPARSGRAVRVDTGGALRFRAQGGLKGAAFGARVDELDSLRSSATNRQAAAVFGPISDEALRESVRRVQRIADDDIRQIVRAHGPLDATANRELAELLIARKRDLVSRFPGLSDEVVAAIGDDATGRITAVEFQRIQDARLNGYVVATDKGDIEDQAVLFYRQTGADGAPQVLAHMKLRDKVLKQLDDAVNQAAGELANRGFDDFGLDAKFMTAVRGLAYRVDQKATLLDKDIARMNEAIDAFHSALASLDEAVAQGRFTAEMRLAFSLHYQGWIEWMQRATSPGVGGKAELMPGELFAAHRIPPPIAGAEPAIRWIRGTDEFIEKEITSGHARETTRAMWRQGLHYEAEVEGVRVRYWPTQGNPFAIQGQLELMAAGDDVHAAVRTVNALERLGVDAVRATDLDREELYLLQIVNHMGLTPREISPIRRLKSPDRRIERLKDLIRTHADVEVDQLPNYRPQGTLQAFEHGRRHAYRPDLEGPEWERFQREYRLVHHLHESLPDALDKILNSGGQMAPTVDKLRRGIRPSGMSPQEDLRTGGASYFFTRIRQREAAKGTEGFVWKSRLVGRLDAISYNHDAYGKVIGNYTARNRKTGIPAWQQTARQGGNETIFKNSLSLFDDLDSIRVKDERRRRQVLDVLRRHGLTEWPDGRSLDEVVKVIGND